MACKDIRRDTGSLYNYLQKFRSEQHQEYNIDFSIILFSFECLIEYLLVSACILSGNFYFFSEINLNTDLKCVILDLFILNVIGLSICSHTGRKGELFMDKF